MKLIKPSYEIITPEEINGDNILKQIERAARTCYKSEDKIGSMIKCNECFGKGWVETDPREPNYKCERCNGEGEIVSWKDLVMKLLERGHEAMLEFGPNITVKFTCDRGVSHELVRHRIASFAQESTRYCNYEKDEHITFIIPEWLDIPQHICDGPEIDKITDSEKYTWMIAMKAAETNYNFLVNNCKWSPQQARSVLPNSLKTEINIDANIREWRHIFKQRVSGAAHPQMREIMRPLFDEIKSKIPVLFDDIKY